MNVETKITIAAVAGLSVGAGIGYFVAEKRLKTKYEALAESEIAEMQEMYEQRQIHDNAKRDNPPRKAPPTEEELNKAYSDAIYDQKLAPSAETLKKAQELVDYRKYYTPSEEPDNVVISEDPRPAPEPEEEYSVEEKAVNGRPFVITVDTFMANDELFEQITLTYYELDKTLADDTDKIIDDVEETIGVDSLGRFGEGSNDPYTVYVRNEQREADYEVIREAKSYRREVGGMDAIEEQFAREPKPRPKKFRDV